MDSFRSSSIRPSLRRPRGGTSSFDSDPDPPFVAIWNDVVAELNGDSYPGIRSTADTSPSSSPLSKEPGSSWSSPWSSPRGLPCCRFRRRSCRTRSNATSASRSSPASAVGSASASNWAFASQTQLRGTHGCLNELVRTTAIPEPDEVDEDDEALRQRRGKLADLLLQPIAERRRRRADRGQSQPPVHLRHLRHRGLQPVRSRRDARDR